MAEDNIVDVGSQDDNEIWLESQWDEPEGVSDPWNATTDSTPTGDEPYDSESEINLPGPDDPTQIPGDYSKHQP